MPEILSVRGLVKAYGGHRAVDEVSFSIGAGEIFGLLGGNGAGKTTTLECAVGLRSPDAGTIRVCGFDPAKQPAEVKRRIGAALQATALQDRITPREAIELFGAFYKRRVHTGDLLERFSLLEKADSAFENLSDGQKQRLALALAFVNAPEVLFLDEPTAGLDARSRQDLHRFILQLRAEGRAVFLTTHYIEEAQALCDRVAVMSAGRIVATGKPSELVARFQAPAYIIARTRLPLDAAALATFELAGSVQTESGEIRIATREVGSAVIALVHRLEAHGNELLDLRVEKPSLEDVFVELTGDPR